MKLGDAVALVAQPIAKGIDTLLQTNVQGCPTCKGRQAALNAFGDSIYDIFWAQPTDKPLEIE